MNWKSMTRRQFVYIAGASAGAFAAGTYPLSAQASGMDDLRTAFIDPPMSSRPWTYWWWLEGAVTKEGITADLEEMRKQGIAGVLLFDCGRTGPSEIKGPKFMSEEWRENFRHAIREAARLGIEVGMSLCTGWDAGGFWVEREDAIKVLVWREISINGPHTLTEHELTHSAELHTFGGPMTKTNPQDWYRELSVVAAPQDMSAWNTSAAISLTAEGRPGERTWKLPAGKWNVMQFGYMLSAKHISLPSSDQLGWEIDPMSARALDNHWRNTAEILLKDAGEHAGKTFKYTHIDSWEIGQPTWTQEFITEFQKRRGYDPLPYLPALVGKTVTDEQTTKRFNYDYRRTIAELTQDNYYGRLSDLSHQHGMGTHSEAGGPFYLQDIDGLACLGRDDIPMGEFWATMPRYEIQEAVSDPFFKSSEKMAYLSHYGSVRQAASAARIYGRGFCQAESYTGFDRDWTEDPYYLKAYGDHAFCLGLGRVVIHHYASVPDFGNPPGNQWEHVSIHFNRYVTWWNKSNAWLRYLARCQHMLRQGDFVADILYYTGEAVPNFALVDKKYVVGFDFDCTNAEALLKFARVKDGRIIFQQGTSYRYLVIPGVAGNEMSLEVLRKLRDLVKDGATLIAERPKTVPGLHDYKQAEQELSRIAAGMWDNSASGEKKLGNGRIIWGRKVEEVIARDGLMQDVEVRDGENVEPFDWIHRHRPDADIYFVANNSEQTIEREFVFRTDIGHPELWDAVTGTSIVMRSYHQQSGCTSIRIKFEAKQSFFVLFPKQSNVHRSQEAFPVLEPAGTLTGAWQVSFDVAWGAPANVTFNALTDWTKHTDDGVRHYSGQAVYRKKFTAPKIGKGRVYLDLGEVKNLAQVYLNGKDLGVVWTAPWRVDITNAIRIGENDLRIEVVNLWPNRLIKDGTLPESQRLTSTNVRTYERVLPKDVAIRNNPIDEGRLKSGGPAELLPSGLIGPVTILHEVRRRS